MKHRVTKSIAIVCDFIIAFGYVTLTLIHKSISATADIYVIVNVV